MRFQNRKTYLGALGEPPCKSTGLADSACKWKMASSYHDIAMNKKVQNVKSCFVLCFSDAPCMVYLPTNLGDFIWATVGKYSSTMEHLIELDY